jgi:hypothetical protein
MGTDFTPLGQQIARMINLVAFDVCDASHILIADTVNPLVKEIRIPLIGQIEKDLQKFIRRSTKSLCKQQGVYAGKILLDREVVVTVYLTRRIKAAWQSDTPQDDPSTSGATDSE